MAAAGHLLADGCFIAFGWLVFLAYRRSKLGPVGPSPKSRVPAPQATKKILLGTAALVVFI